MDIFVYCNDYYLELFQCPKTLKSPKKIPLFSLLYSTIQTFQDGFVLFIY